MLWKSIAVPHCQSVFVALRFFAICIPCVPMHNAPKVGLSSSKSSKSIARTSCFCAISFCALKDVLRRLIIPAILSAIRVLLEVFITWLAELVMEETSLK